MVTCITVPLICIVLLPKGHTRTNTNRYYRHFAFSSLACRVEQVSFFKWAIPGFLLFSFGLFKHTLLFLQQYTVKKCPPGMRCWDSNLQPLERESRPITTRPGHPLVSFSRQSKRTNFLGRDVTMMADK